MPLTHIFKLIGLFILPPIALAYGIFGGDGRVELAVLALAATVFFVAHAIEKKRQGS